MPDEQSVLNEPGPAPETAAQAFARLDGRIALMSRAVEHLAAERASIDIPDYNATLGQMNTRLAGIAQGLAGIAEKPAMLLTPEGLAARMDAAAEKSRRTDSATLREAREAHQEAARIIRDLAGVIREKHEQRKRLLWVAGGGVLGGCLLWSFLPGAIARTLPEGWHMPERMAAHVLRLEPWAAGERMLAGADQERWQILILANRILQGNREAIATCRHAARRAHTPQRCPVTIGPDHA